MYIVHLLPLCHFSEFGPALMAKKSNTMCLILRDPIFCIWLSLHVYEFFDKVPDLTEQHGATESRLWTMTLLPF